MTAAPSKAALFDTLLHKRTLRFALTGIFVTAVHTAIAIAFVKYAKQDPPLANGIAFIGATAISYLINTVWSFSSRLHGITLFRFIAVSFLGLLMAIVVAAVAQRLGLNYLLGIAAVALTVPPLTFVLHNFWTYR